MLKAVPHVKPAVDVFVINTLIAYKSLSDPVSFKYGHPQIIQQCTFPMEIFYSGGVYTV